jgi:hypothetical protein
MDPDQTARMCRLVWIYAGRKRTMLVLSWSGSIVHMDILTYFYHYIHIRATDDPLINIQMYIHNQCIIWKILEF